MSAQPPTSPSPPQGLTPSDTPPAPDDARLGRITRSLLLGNVVIGSGVMVVAGTLNDIAASLQVSVATAGRLIAIAAAVVAVGAPLLAVVASGWDRRRLLVGALWWYGLGHLLCALMDSYAALWPVRALTVLAAAVFTPQAAAAVGFLAPPSQRGRRITQVFLGWSVAAVIGVPVAAWVGETWGWRIAMAGVGVLSCVVAVRVGQVMPDGVRPPGLSLRAWGRVLGSRVWMGMIGVTALTGWGQFLLMAYFSPYFKQVLQASPLQMGLLFGWFGALGLLGNLLLSQRIDRLGPGRAVALALSLIALSLLVWPLGTGVAGMMLVVMPWGFAWMASNSAQQARLGTSAPLLAAALMALNTSAIYLGQALGAFSGGWLIERQGYARLHLAALALVLCAWALSAWVERRVRRMPPANGAG